MNLTKLFIAYYDCRKNKRKTASAIKFELDYESNLIQLHGEIMNRTYTIGKSIAFIVDRPVLVIARYEAIQSLDRHARSSLAMTKPSHCDPANGRSNPENLICNKKRYTCP